MFLLFWAFGLGWANTVSGPILPGRPGCGVQLDSLNLPIRVWVPITEAAARRFLFSRISPQNERIWSNPLTYLKAVLMYLPAEEYEFLVRTEGLDGRAKESRAEVMSAMGLSSSGFSAMKAQSGTTLASAMTAVRNAPLPEEERLSLRYLGLCTKTERFLMFYGLVSVAQIIEMTEEEFLKIPNVGTAVLGEVREALTAKSLSFAKERPVVTTTQTEETKNTEQAAKTAPEVPGLDVSNILNLSREQRFDLPIIHFPLLRNVKTRFLRRCHTLDVKTFGDLTRLAPSELEGGSVGKKTVETVAKVLEAIGLPLAPEPSDIPTAEEIAEASVEEKKQWGIHTLGLPARCDYPLRMRKIITLAEVVQRRERDFLAMRQFGPVCLSKLKESLERVGLSLKP